jgi:glutamate 5-kinase
MEDPSCSLTLERCVVKIGSQVLCDEQGELNTPVLASLIEQLATLHQQGWQVLVVSSGAVAAGMGKVGASQRDRNDPVTRKQVLAATGQVRLMQTYAEQFELHDLTVAQVLASKSDFQTRSHYLNMRNCIEGILDAGIIPIINENDVVSITELMFTDNDELAGLLAGMVNADLLCMLTSVPGVFDGQTVIEQWDDQIHRIENIVGDGTSKLGRGGMHSKLSAALKTAALGTEVVIADGRRAEVLTQVINGEKTGTRFLAGNRSTPTRRWLATADDHAVGTVKINEGAEVALRDTSRLASLLLVGAVGIEGTFSRGDVIKIMGADNRVLGVGRAQYDSAEALELLGEKGLKPLIHYDYLYLSA